MQLILEKMKTIIGKLKKYIRITLVKTDAGPTVVNIKIKFEICGKRKIRFCLFNLVFQFLVSLLLCFCSCTILKTIDMALSSSNKRRYSNNKIKL